MKYLLPLLIAFNVQAEWRVEVSTLRGDTFKEGMTSQECQDWLDDNLKKLKGHKHHDSFGIADRWLDNNDKPGFINSRIIESEDSEGNPVFNTEYFYPANYTVGAIEDISVQVKAAKDAKAADVTDRGQVKNVIRNMDFKRKVDETPVQWLTRVMPKIERALKRIGRDRYGKD